MKTYESHYLSREMSKEPPGEIIDPVVAMRETPGETPPDERSKLLIEEVERAERMREREEERPVDPAPARMARIAEEAAAANFDRDDIVFPLVVASCERALRAARAQLKK